MARTSPAKRLHKSKPVKVGSPAAARTLQRKKDTDDFMKKRIKRDGVPKRFK
jgi:hypothetical protein